MFFWDWTYLLLIPGLILGIWAQAKVNGAYSKYSRVPSQLGRPASQVVGDLRRRNGNNAMEVTSVSGNLTDHYNPATETRALSQCCLLYTSRERMSGSRALSYMMPARGASRSISVLVLGRS